MTAHRIPQQGDIYWIDPNPIAGREMKNRHPFIVITPREINALGVAMTVPATSGGKFLKSLGLRVSIVGYKTKGIAVCNQVRSFDIQARVNAGSAKYIETLNPTIINEIIDRVISIIDPAS